MFIVKAELANYWGLLEVIQFFSKRLGGKKGFGLGLKKRGFLNKFFQGRD